MLNDYLPHGTLFDETGEPLGGFDSSTYERKMAEWERGAFEEALRTKRLSPEEGRVQTTTDYLSGAHWNSEKRARYKSKFYINKTGRARQDNLALLTDSRPDIEVNSKLLDYEPQAKLVDALLRTEWVQNDWDLSLVTAVDIAKAAGTSFWKMTGASPGMMRIIPLGPDCVMPIQPGMHIQESTAVLYRTWKSLNEIIQRYPTRAKDLERQSVSSYSSVTSGYRRPDHIDPITWHGLAPQMQRLVSRGRMMADDMAQEGYFRTVEWREYYVEDLSVNLSNQNVVMRSPYLPLDQHNWWYVVKPGQRLYPHKRLISFAGKKLIYDGPSPYWHGLFPFACLRLNPVFWSFWGLGGYRDLIPVNAAINEIIAGVLDMVKRALNPQMIARGAAINKDTWNSFFPDMPGAKLYLQNASAVPANDIMYVKPPDIPAYVFQILAQYLGPEYDKLAGIVDIASLTKKNQVPGGDTIEQMRDSLQTALRLEGRYVETFLKDAGIQAISHIFQFYSAPQRLKLLGPDGITFQDFDSKAGTLTPDTENKYDHWRNFRISVVPGSLHGGSKDRSKALAVSLAAMGAISKRELLRRLEFNNIDKIMEELNEEMQAMAGAGGSPLRLNRGQRNGSPV